MPAKRWLRALVLATSLTVGCVGPTLIVQQYDGPVRPRESIAILRIMGNDTVQIMSLDGAPTNAAIDADTRLHIEMLPGEHRVAIATLLDRMQPAQVVWFSAAPGKTYRALWNESVLISSGGLRQARVFEVDEDGRPLRDVSSATSLREQRPAPPGAAGLSGGSASGSETPVSRPVPPTSGTAAGAPGNMPPMGIDGGSPGASSAPALDAGGAVNNVAADGGSAGSIDAGTPGDAGVRLAADAGVISAGRAPASDAGVIDAGRAPATDAGVIDAGRAPATDAGAR